MEKKWNLQDIQPATPRKRRRVVDEADLTPSRPKQEITEEHDGTMRIDIEDGNAKKRSHLVIALVVFFVIVGLGFVFSFLMAGAEITVYPRNREPNVNATFTAYRTPQVGELTYEIMTLEADGERQVAATGKEEVQEQAAGKIIIYNETSGTERLKKNTRFETESGLIFKITESAVVPGARTNNAGELVPGSIQAEVFADAMGEEYNLDTKTKLRIPGYKEGGYTELYESVYAENPEPITGGFSGMKFIIDDQELETEKQRLQTELRNALLSRIESEAPAGFVIFDEAVTFTYQSLPAVEYGENLATIKEKALLQIPMFEKDAFAKYIAAATVPGYEQLPVRIEDPEAFTFKYTNATTSASDIGNLDSLSFTLTGKPLIVWTYDEGKLKTDIMGKSSTALNTVLGGYPAIEKGRATIRPFWKRSFPDKLEDITIIEIVEGQE